MARPLRLHIPGAIYHVMSRGNAKQDIFLDDIDRERFLALLGDSCDRFGVRCLTYCLMGNHYHALLQPQELTLSRMMQQLNSTYCQWFNRRHGRVGHVLQGRFKALLVDYDVYLLRAVRYILRNPLADARVANPGHWKWSSYRAIAGLEHAPAFLHVDSILAMFTETTAATAQQQFERFVAHTEDDGYPGGPFVYGSNAFKMRVNALLEPNRANSDFVYRERFAGRPPLHTLFLNVYNRSSMDSAMRDAYLQYAYTLREIADLAGCSHAAVWSRVHGVNSRTGLPTRRAG
jgi:REP-associated tyrosine transposase